MVLCVACGTKLLQAIGEETITTEEGVEMVFRRTSDYLLCPNRDCLRLYSVGRIRADEKVTYQGEPPDLAAELSELAKGSVRRLRDAGFEPLEAEVIPLEDQFDQ